MPSSRRLRSIAAAACLALSGLTLSAVTAQQAAAATDTSKIVSAARSQLGSDGCGIVDCSVEWCAEFSKWAWQQGGVDVTTLGATVTTFVNYGDANGTWHDPSGYTPQPGDAMIFGGPGFPTKASGGAHVGLVESVNSNGTITEIGGNQGHKVTEVTGTAASIETQLEGSSYSFLGYVSPLGVPAPTPPANAAASDSSWAVYNPNARVMSLFGLGSGGHLGFTNSLNGGASWSNWAEANGYWTLQGTPSAVYDPDAKATLLFARGSADGAMGISRSTNNAASWSNWTQVNPYWTNFKGDASAVYNSTTKRVTVFARGGDGRIGYTQSTNGGVSWTNWAEVNAYWNNFSGDPHVIFNPTTNRMTVFARGGDGRIGYTQSTNDGASWSNWAEVNAYWNNFSGDPHIVLNPTTNRMTVFARGGDGRICYTQSTNDGASWSNWAEVNAYWNNFSGDPRPVYNPHTKTISLLARGGDGRIGYTQSTNDGASWSNWNEANAYWNNFTGDPTPVYDPDTTQNTAFALGSGGHMGYTQSNSNGWTNWSEVNAYWTLIGS
ncbi:hypothetical protein SAMN05216267_102289 [Actinacidiphila rubida]|uniref:Peptidase C51 domain-containing protein n=2 Tax=Actinacidiphila rubida TaxID=310780 RepID=A0A1H8NIU5_9ACTN|nr:CHAP domain-containing protein [Actinacidiphila rubida]SEO29524.1 hypothetical protein SAMN05216267_102289 [Actinacidiphila rubida]